ncbi:MAG TPA: alpha/beta fold hydrolase, partial [Phytomonospora sp.]
MADFALVHGSFHGAWCWERVTPLLAAAGHRVRTPDLDGGRKGAADVLSELDGPAILVGHSSGGMLISALARLAPESATALVYLSGFLLAAGRTPHDLGGGRGSLFERALAVDRDAGTMTIRPEFAGELFYHDCPPAVAAGATARLVPEVLRRGGSAPADRPDPDVPRLYIECLDDRAL